MTATPIQGRPEMLPRNLLVLAGALVVFVIVAVAASRIAGLPLASSPVAMRAAANVAPVASRRLRFVDRADGAVVIQDARTGGTASVIPAGEETGFVRGVMRALARERRQNGIGAGIPFDLTLWRNGQLSLTDLATGRSIEMTAFGSTNRATFAALLAPGKTA